MPQNPFEDARCVLLHLVTEEQENKFTLQEHLQNHASSSLGYSASLHHKPKASTPDSHNCDEDLRVFFTSRSPSVSPGSPSALPSGQRSKEGIVGIRGLILSPRALTTRLPRVKFPRVACELKGYGGVAASRVTVSHAAHPFDHWYVASGCGKTE